MAIPTLDTIETPTIFHNRSNQQDYIRVGIFTHDQVKEINALTEEDFQKFYREVLVEYHMYITGSENIFHFKIKNKSMSPKDFFKVIESKTQESITLIVPRFPEDTPHFLMLEDFSPTDIIVPSIKYHLYFKDQPVENEITQPDMNVFYETHIFKLKAILPTGDPLCPNVYSDRFIREIIIKHNIRGKNIKYMGKQTDYEKLIANLANNCWSREQTYFLYDEETELIRYTNKTKSIAAV